MVFEELKDQSFNFQNIRSGEKVYLIYETYKNTVIPYGRHIYAKTSYIKKATMCAYPQDYHELTHLKCVL